MTRDETKIIIRSMMASYPNYKPMDVSETVDVWTMLLKDYSYKDISIALQTYITTDTQGFAPAIGQLIAKVNMVKNPSFPSELEAWSMVSRALRNGTYHAQEEFAKLPEIVQKTVGHYSNLQNWAQTDVESIENVVQSNFIKTYRTLVKRETEIAAMPSEVRNRIESTNQQMAIGVASE